MIKNSAKWMAVSAVAIIHGSAYAQSGGDLEKTAQFTSETSSIGMAAQGARGGEGGPIEDIVVTARRKEESLQSVPVAVTAVSESVLASNNITTVRELQLVVPSLTVSTGFTGSTANFVIRGQGAAGLGGIPAVAVYLNEVPLPFEFNGTLSAGPGMLFDLENVQVLKGPQGTLFGRNTMGGAILLQTARPKEDFGGRVQVAYGNYNNREIDGALNLPIVSDKILARIAFNVQKRDGYTYVQSTPSRPDGIRLNDRDSWGVRGTLRFAPSDTFSNDLTVSYNRYKYQGFAEFFIGEYLDEFDPTGAYFNPGLKGLIRNTLAAQSALGSLVHLPTTTDFNGSGGSLLSIQNSSTLKLSDDARVRNIIGYNRATWDFAESDIDGTAFPFLETLQSTYRNRQITEELQIQGTSLDKRLDWVVGGLYLTERPLHDQPAPNVDDLWFIENRIFGTISSSLRKRWSTSKALYAQGTYKITPNLRFTAGLRYTWDKRFEANANSATLVRLPDLVASSRAPTWTLGLDYQANKNTLIYVASRRGYRAGGSQTLGTLQVPFGPEYLTDFEGGIKADWHLAGMPIRTNGAIFYQKYRDIQIVQTTLLTFPDGSTQVGPITANAAAARLWGAELEVTANVTPRLQLGGNFSYLNFKYTDFKPGVSAIDLLKAGRADRVPWTWAVNGRYNLPVNADLGELTLQASYGWRDRAYDTAGINRLNSYGVANASLNWNNIAQSGVDASLFVSNLTNKKYIAGGTSFFGFNVGTYGEPRMYGIRVGYRFGSEKR